jgi:RHS repeat-associated protein
VETFNYDHATGLLSSQGVRRGSSTLLDLAYTYFPSGQLRQLSEGGETLNYDYDNLGRILDVKASGSNTWSEAYAFDSYGNRISVVASGRLPDGSPIPLDGLAGSPTPPNGLAALTYDPRTNHILTPGFAYDAAGNQTRVQRLDGSWVRYQYDQAGRLAQVAEDSGNVLEQYAYGADGIRLQRIDPRGGTTSYFWDGGQVIAEYEQGSARTKWAWSKGHAYLGRRILATFVPKDSGERVYYHHPDRLGTRLITSNADNTASEQVTLPFGTRIPGREFNPLNPVFTTYDRSSGTGLDYAMYRDYDPQQRFVEVDPIGMAAVDSTNPQSLNLYAYVGNDPVNRIDSHGFIPDGPIGNSEDLRAWEQAAVWGGAGALTGPEGAFAGFFGGLYSVYVNDLHASVVALANGTQPPIAWDPVGPFFSTETSEPITVASLTLSGYLSSETVTTSITADYGSRLVGDNYSETTTITVTNFSDGSTSVTITDPDGSQTLRQTDSNGNQQTTSVDANGNVTSQSSVDINGNPIGGGSGCSTDATVSGQNKKVIRGGSGRTGGRGGRGRMFKDVGDPQPCQ